MHVGSSFQRQVRVIAISLSIILILGGCSSSLAGKEKKEDQKTLIVSGLGCTDTYTMAQ